MSAVEVRERPAAAPGAEAPSAQPVMVQASGVIKTYDTGKAVVNALRG